MISKITIDKVFQTALVEEVVGDFIQIKKSGSNYKGLSPFTNEKTPSFIVSPTKQIWKDFSSGKGGNVIAFLMEHEQYSYPQAIRYLADKYNIEIIETEMQLADLESIEKRLTKKNKKVNDEIDYDILKNAYKIINENKSFDILYEKFSSKELKMSGLLSLKPKLYVCNVDEKSVTKGNTYTEIFEKKFGDINTIEGIVQNGSVCTVLGSFNCSQRFNNKKVKIVIREEAIKLFSTTNINLNTKDDGEIPMHNVFPRLSETSGKINREAPQLGQDNKDILSEIGYSKDEISTLEKNKII